MIRRSRMRIAVFVLTCLPSLAWSALATGPADTTAKVSATVGGKPLPLQRPEQIALMFMSAISNLEDDCIRHAGHACSLDELVNGTTTQDNWKVGHLKFDPRTTDPNYTYTVNAGKNSFEAKAIPKKPGLGGFFTVKPGFGFGKKYYNPQGEASITSEEIDSSSIEGDLFQAH